MYLCRPYMGVRNLPPGPEWRQAESAQGAPAQHIRPSPGQEGGHEYPITSPLSQAGLRIPPSGSSLPHLTAMHPVLLCDGILWGCLDLTAGRGGM